jgi:hypothetical protein
MVNDTRLNKIMTEIFRRMNVRRLVHVRPASGYYVRVQTFYGCQTGQIHQLAYGK